MGIVMGGQPIWGRQAPIAATGEDLRFSKMFADLGRYSQINENLSTSTKIKENKRKLMKAYSHF